jgi:hypothetical protein
VFWYAPNLLHKPVVEEKATENELSLQPAEVMEEIQTENAELDEDPEPEETPTRMFFLLSILISLIVSFGSLSIFFSFILAICYFISR